MSTNTDSLRTHLLASDDEFRRLYEEHQSFESRLQELHLKTSLSEEDELEAKSIKRHKLWLKDRMEHILRSEREVQTPA